MQCDNKLANFVARYAVWYGRMASPLGPRVFQCCSSYDCRELHAIEPVYSFIPGYYWSMVSHKGVERVFASGTVVYRAWDVGLSFRLLICQ